MKNVRAWRITPERFSEMCEGVQLNDITFCLLSAV
jgi:hypothetical protein